MNTLVYVALILLHHSSIALHRPNIVFMLADDLGWNDVSMQGSEIPTPNIDAMAYNGIGFSRHYSQPLCTPSRTALFTSKYPSKLGMQGAPIVAGTPIGLPLSEKLFPQYMKELNYSTHLVGKWHLGSMKREYLPTSRGFDSHYGYWNGYIDHYSSVHIRIDKEAGLDFHRGLSGAWNETTGTYITYVLTDEAVKIIRNHSSDEGLFLVITHAAPHCGNPGDTLLQKTPNGLGSRGDVIKDQRRRMYADMVKELDDSVGTVVQTLKETNMLNNTIIIFVADNGAPTTDLKFLFSNHGSNWPLRGEKISLFEGGVRTVAAMWSPDMVNPGRTFNNMFHITDWLPTLYHAAGGDSTQLKNIDGHDQWNSLKYGPTKIKPSRNTLLVEMLNNSSEAMIHNVGNKLWKLIKGYAPSSSNAFSDLYYGVGARNINVYNETEIYLCQTNSVLKTKDIGLDNMIRKIQKMRKEMIIDDKCGPRILGEKQETQFIFSNCSSKYCLFDLDNDPCEYSDVAQENPDMVKVLDSLLEPYRATLQPKLDAPLDPLANPSCWSNYWVPWQDNTPLTPYQCHY